jgi:hypothetical protein
VQLGELQSQLKRFELRGARVIAVSVDKPNDSLAMITRMGLAFDLASDPEQSVVRAYGVQNPTTKELALHAVYIVDSDARIFYRKVALRRPTSNELIDAIDYHLGRYPQHDDRQPTVSRVAVAYPRNNYQALIEVAAVNALPAPIDAESFAKVLDLAGRDGDDALVAFKALMTASTAASSEQLLNTASWLTRSRFLPGNTEAIALGNKLGARLLRVAQLETAHATAKGTQGEDAALQELARARGSLSLIRAEIDQHAAQWSLRYMKASLRGYREVARAARR